MGSENSNQQKQKMKNLSKKRFVKFALVIIPILGILTFTSCKMADLRTTAIKDNTQTAEQILFAKELLAKTVKKHGFDKINQFATYELIGSDHWKGLLGTMGNPWDWNKDEIALRFSVGDFDGQLEVLAGEKSGFVAGIQSWDYYEKVNGDYKTDVADDERKIFNLAAIHYFFELPYRLSSKASFVRYAGEDKIRGKQVDKIFISWENAAVKDYDHYVLWISKESGLIEAVQFTTREAPAPKFLKSVIQFEDYRNIDGVFIPFKQSVQMGDPEDNTSKFIHQITINKFDWDSFPISDIRPFSEVEAVGDAKPYKN